MKVEFKKTQDGGAALSCIRREGTRTWKRPKPTQASFFALHDLTHFAVESELPELQGFFSMIEAGWSIDDFETTGAPLPQETLIAETIVGLLDAERASKVTGRPTTSTSTFKDIFLTSRSKRTSH